ncbi:growth hormone secretagogue receptor type 1-like [Rhopilema esculentum]|uniref:growth hormone secretagogue receptor type 1-like n=1 Tax=Rhopilema esculentum TaxID=499914 RepID=UPI0031D8F235|eukprot:gene9701-18169_t
MALRNRFGLFRNTLSNFTSLRHNFTNIKNGSAFDLLPNIVTGKVILFERWDFRYLYHLMITVAFVAVFLNCYILSLVVRTKKLRHKHNIFPINLTLSDAFVGFVVIPLFVIGQYMLEDTLFDRFLESSRVYHISSVTLMFSSLVNIYSVAAIVVERLVAICLPFKHRQSFTRSKATVTVLAIWILSILFAAFSFYVYEKFYTTSHVDSALDAILLVLSVVKSERKYKGYDDSFIWICLAGSLTAGSGLVATQVVLCRRRRASKIRRSATQNVTRRSEEIKATVMLSLMFMAIIIWLIPIIRGRKLLNRELSMYLYLGRFCLSIVNPILYTLLKQDIRTAAAKDFRALKNFILRSFCRRCIHTSVTSTTRANNNNKRSVSSKSDISTTEI